MEIQRDIDLRNQGKKIVLAELRDILMKHENDNPDPYDENPHNKVAHRLNWYAKLKSDILVFLFDQEKELGVIQSGFDIDGEYHFITQTA